MVDLCTMIGSSVGEENLGSLGGDAELAGPLAMVWVEFHTIGRESPLR
jgi:hypothetical protein